MKPSTLKVILKNILLQRRSIGGYISTNSLLRKTDITVKSGPFAGMKYVENSTGSSYFPKLLGTYEMELYDTIEKFSKIKFDEIINVGAAEGYFSVGFAMRFPNSQIISFEPQFYGCYLLEKLAALNVVSDRIKIKAQLCEPEDLNQTINTDKKTLIFMDVEGTEIYLLDKTKVPKLDKCFVIVEIHDGFVPELAETIQKRFADTHTITEIWQEQRTIKDLTVNSIWKTLLKKQYETLLNEGRSNRMRWFVMEPK